MLKELGKGLFNIGDLRKHFQFIKDHGGRTFGIYEEMGFDVQSRYSNKPIKYITVEEFRAGKSGYLLVNFRTEFRTPQI